jgi:L-ascorbate metabolism protein UlaG (beta-lactamase superfamily)
LVIDPFFDENPSCQVSAANVEADYVLVTHGHGDHFSDCIPLARRTGATVISTFEIVSFCREKGVRNGHGMNVGGAYNFPFGRVKLTPALHTGSVAGDREGAHAGGCTGFLIEFNGKRVYHAGDTALTMDLMLLKGQVDVALLPIGDNFTMGPDDAVRAVEMIEPKVVIPIHYNTWPVIAQNPESFKAKVGSLAQVEVLAPGSSYEF